MGSDNDELQQLRNAIASHYVNAHAIPVLIGLEQLVEQPDSPGLAELRRRWRDVIMRLVGEPPADYERAT